jgi:hypothetical protein
MPKGEPFDKAKLMESIRVLRESLRQHRAHTCTCVNNGACAMNIADCEHSIRKIVRRIENNR